MSAITAVMKKEVRDAFSNWWLLLYGGLFTLLALCAFTALAARYDKMRKQVEASIPPAATSLVGDYSVGLMADGEKSSKTVEMRVTVKAPTAWGWIGVGLIAVAIGGMGGLFIWLGRR